MPDVALVIGIATIAAVICFDFTNGFHDASNMISTLVASRAMTPAQSVMLVGFFTMLGPLLGGTAVANTIGGFVIIDDLPTAYALELLFCGVLGAIAWNLLTWRFGLPSSSSHALIGGITAVVVVGPGPDHVLWGTAALGSGHLEGIAKVVVALVVSPMVGFGAGFLLHRLMRLLLRRATPAANTPLRRGQWLTAAALAFAHGTNDAQKGMGIITLVLLLTGTVDRFEVPLWVMTASALTLTLGTTLGGWRIVRTLGFGLYKLRALHGFNAQSASGAVILAASLFGGPVSTTHVVSTSIMGVGAAERPRAVRWQRATDIVVAWLLTFPGAGLLALATWWLGGWIGLWTS